MAEARKRNEQAITFKSELSHKPVICTAGRSYFVVRGDGSIYRCLYNPKVLGNVRDGRLPQLEGEKQLTCTWKNSHDKLVNSCHPSGDLMFATYWEEDDSGKLVKNEADWPHWSEPEDPRQVAPVKDKVYFQVLPVNSRCNHACQYCCNFYYENPDGTVVGRPKDHEKDLPIEAWRTFLSNMKEHVDFAHFGFLGGEPMLYSHIVDLAITIVNDYGWEVGICSNMSLTRKFQQICDGIRDDRRHLMRFSASLHPTENRGFKWENYWSSVKYCKDSGHDVRATMVSWPEQTFLYEELREKLGSIGVDLHLKGCGGYEIPGSDWEYIGKRDGTLETPEYLRKIGWFEKGRDPRMPRV